MTNDPLDTRLREIHWQRKLTSSEAAELQAWLAAHPEARAEWDMEVKLNHALGRLPDVPLASNFTARVLQAVERDAAVAVRRQRGPWPWSWRLHWLPRIALAAVVLGAGFVSYREFESLKFSRYGQSVAAVSNVSSLPGPDVLRDFDAIRALNRTPAADEDLLAALK
jgi:anti-sigma factor RsiW